MCNPYRIHIIASDTRQYDLIVHYVHFHFECGSHFLQSHVFTVKCLPGKDADYACACTHKALKLCFFCWFADAATTLSTTSQNVHSVRIDVLQGR